MKKIIIVLIILVGNFVNLYYMGQNAEKESEQELSVTNFENVQNDNAIIEEKEKDLNIADINETKENVVIDGRTGQVLDGVQVPDKETMRNVTPPKGPLKNAKPMEFEDLNKRAADNIRNMHDTADAMRQNAINARLIDMSRNGGRPTPRGRGQNKLLGNNFGRNAA